MEMLGWVLVVIGVLLLLMCSGPLGLPKGGRVLHPAEQPSCLGEIIGAALVFLGLYLTRFWECSLPLRQ